MYNVLLAEIFGQKAETIKKLKPLFSQPNFYCNFF